MTTADGRLLNQEVGQQTERRRVRVEEFNDFYDGLNDDEVADALRESASCMHLTTDVDAAGQLELKQIIGPTLIRRVLPRQKRIFYDASLLPKIDTKKEYAAGGMVTEAMKIFARDLRVISVDSDLGTTSGLEGGVGAVDQTRATFCWNSIIAAASSALPNRTTATSCRTSTGYYIAAAEAPLRHTYTASIRWMAKVAPRFILSGTYEELLQTFGMAPDAITETIKERLNG